jgi:hypothetical protein
LIARWIEAVAKLTRMPARSPKWPAIAQLAPSSQSIKTIQFPVLDEDLFLWYSLSYTRLSNLEMAHVRL